MYKYKLIKAIVVIVVIILLGDMIKNIYKVNKNNRNTGNEKKKYNKVDIILSTSVSIIALILTFVVSIVHVEGKSMQPNFQDGQIVLLNDVDKVYRPGDVIVFYSEKEDKLLIKRIIAEGNATVEVKAKRIYVDDKVIHENYDTVDFDNDFIKILVPEGKYFVMGDNRPISYDSRYEEIGCIDRKYIQGKVIELKKEKRNIDIISIKW